jgi:hypothetical protein
MREDHSNPSSICTLKDGYIRESMVGHPRFCLAHRQSFVTWVVSRDQLVTLTTTTPPKSVRLLGITLDHGLLRTVPADGHTRSWDERTDGYIDLQPDGNSFDMLSGLICLKK